MKELTDAERMDAWKNLTEPLTGKERLDAWKNLTEPKPSWENFKFLLGAGETPNSALKRWREWRAWKETKEEK